jgi:hypothetical protein
MTDAYLSAPATRFVATHCACCGKALVDALSVERAIGPECYKRHGADTQPGLPDWNSARTFLANFGKDIAATDPALLTTTDARMLCNVLIHRFAKQFRTARWIPDCIFALGFVKLAERLAKRARVHLGQVTSEPAPTVRITIETVTDTWKGKTQVREVFTVRAPFSPDFNNAAVPGRWFDRKIKAWRVPVASKPALWTALQGCFKGLPLVTPKGATVTIQ